MDLTDRQWQAIQDQMPPAHQGRGRPALDSRRVLNGIFWKIRSDSPWRDLPSRYPSHQSCYRFYKQWQSSGLFKSLVCSLYSDLVYRGNFTPYQAAAENRIMLKVRGRSFKLYIVPRYHDDWRTLTALLFMQILLKMGLRHLGSESGTGRIQMTGVHKFLFPFSDWTKYAPFNFSGEMSQTFTGPEDVVLEIGRD